jgi:penicillin-binding protein 1A
MPQSSPAQPPVALPVPVAPAGGAPAGNAPPAIPPIPVPRVDADTPARASAVNGAGPVAARPL